MGKLGESKRKPNAKRVWIEGERLGMAGFTGGTRFSISEDGQSLSLILNNHGTNKVSERRSKPIIDLTSRFIAEKFKGYTHVKIVIMENHIRIMPSPLEKNILESKKLLAQWFEKGNIPMVDIFTGGSTSSSAMRHASKGKIETVQHIECDPFYSDLADKNHKESLSIMARIQDVDIDDIVKAAVAAIWWPCTDHSMQGRSKKKISMPEAGEFGYLFHQSLNIVKAVNPAIVVGECVPSFKNSAAMAVTRSVLKDMGYCFQDEAILKAPDFGGATRRERFIFMASRLGPVSIPRNNSKANTAKLSDILIPEEEAHWLTALNSKTIDYLINVHGKKHDAKGNGFGIQKSSVLPNSPHMPTITRTYGKLQPAGLLRKAEGLDEFRQFTPEEVLKAHQLDGIGLILPDAKTRKYEVLGQGTEGGMIGAVAKYIVKHVEEFLMQNSVGNIGLTVSEHNNAL